MGMAEHDHSDTRGTGGEGATMATTTPICSTCCQPVDRPHRVVVDGVVVEGCVSAAHDHVADDWHRRPVAEALRADEAETGWATTIDPSDRWRELVAELGEGR